MRLRAGLGLLEQELGQAEDREQRVVDLVRDAGRELADRGELAALHELLLHAALLGGVLDQREQQRRLAVVARHRARRPGPGCGLPSGRRKTRSNGRADRRRTRCRLLVVPPRVRRRRRRRRRQRGRPTSCAERVVHRSRARAWPGRRRRSPTGIASKSACSVCSLQLFSRVLVGDVPEHDHGAARRRRDAAVEHELAAVERGDANAEGAAGAVLRPRPRRAAAPGRPRRACRPGRGARTCR